MFFYNWFYSKSRYKKSLTYFIFLANINNNHIEVKRIISIARNIGFSQNEIEKIIKLSLNKTHVMPTEFEKKFNALYEFITFINEIHEDVYDLDLCIEMAIILGYERFYAPTIAREIYHGLLSGESKKDIREKIYNLEKRISLNLSEPNF